MGTRIFVCNLAFQTTEQDLRQLFAKVGTVLSVTVEIARNTGLSKGVGYVEMDKSEDAQKAISQLNGHSLNDRAIRVDWAPQFEDHDVGRQGS
jgi:RNA recognition motif-containing protein